LNVEEGVKNEGKWRMNEEWRPNTNMHFSCLLHPTANTKKTTHKKRDESSRKQTKGNGCIFV
jgi:hypothetical protein